MPTTKFNPKNTVDIPKFSQEQIKKFQSLKDDQLDYSDIDDFASNPSFWKYAKIVKKSPKKQISFRVDEDVLKYFKEKSKGKGYQTMMNEVLKSYLSYNNN